MDTFCTYYNKKMCHSCTKIEQSYSEQLVAKERTLSEALHEFNAPKPLPSIQSPNQQFRHKAKFTVTGSISRPIIGLLGETQLDQGREILNCPIHLPVINQIAQNLITFIQDANIPPYQIEEKKGELKGIIINVSYDSTQAYVRLVLRSKESIDRIKKHLSSWLEIHTIIGCFSINLQPIPHAILEGEEEIYLTTEQTILQRYPNNIMFNLSPKGFVQTNQKVAASLYLQAATWTEELKINNFLELFCGQGAFSFFIAPHVTNAMGIEINQNAVLTANQTAHTLGLHHLTFKAQNAKDVKEEIKSFKPDLILVNPPRRGLGESLELIQDCHCKYLIYSSCSVESLKKDLMTLTRTYKIKKLQLFDMFPHTNHFETLVMLESLS